MNSNLNEVIKTDTRSPSGNIATFLLTINRSAPSATLTAFVASIKRDEIMKEKKKITTTSHTLSYDTVKNKNNQRDEDLGQNKRQRSSKW